MSRSFLVLLITLFLISAPIVLGSSSSIAANVTASGGSSSAAATNTSASVGSSSLSAGLSSSAAGSNASVSSVMSSTAMSGASSSGAQSTNSTVSSSGASSVAAINSSASSSLPFSSSAASTSVSSVLSPNVSSLSSTGSSAASSSSMAAGVNASSGGGILPPPIGSNVSSSSSGYYNSSSFSSSSSSSSSVVPVQTIYTCTFNYFAVPTYQNLTYFYVNASFTYNAYQQVYYTIYGNNATCFNLISLSGYRIVYYNNTVNDTEIISGATTTTSQSPVLCFSSPYLTSTGFVMTLTNSNGAYVNQGTNQVFLALNATNYGNTSSPTAASQYEYYTDYTSAVRINPITQFTLDGNCPSNFNNNNNNNQQSSDAYSTAKLSTYVLGMIIAVATTLLMVL